MKPYVYPHLMGSSGARELARALGTIRVRANGRYKPRSYHTVINWGNTTIPNWWGTLASRCTINKPQAVMNASDKIRAFQLFSANGVPTLDWTTDPNVARGWFNSGDTKVMCRTLTRASEGRGIVVAKKSEELVYAPLYTKYKKKVTEYRVHAGMGKVFDFQMKKRKTGLPPSTGPAQYVRNSENGWVFCRNNVILPDGVADAGIRAVQALGLDFGAVDIGVSADGSVAVYEVNTAPGLEGATTINYTNFFKGLL